MARKIRQYTNQFLKAKGPLFAPEASALPNLEDAIALHQQGLLGQAEVIYRQLLEIEPRNADALHLLGVIACQTGSHQSSVDMIDQAIAINPNVESYHSNRGIALLALKQLDVAVASFDKAIALKPDYAEAYYNRGVALKELKQFDAAITSYDKAIALKPDYAEAYASRGNSLKESKQFDAAVASYDKAIALKPDYAEAYSNRGNALQDVKQFDAAVVSYDKAIALKPDYAEAYSNRGNALKELKQFHAAVASYDKAIALKPDYAEAYSNRGNALQDVKQFDAAVASYDKAIAFKPDYAEAYSNRGVALKELKQFEAAVASYDKAYDLNLDIAYLSGIREMAKLTLCDWQNFDVRILELRQRIHRKQKATSSFVLLSLPFTPSEQRLAAEIWCEDKFPRSHFLGPMSKSLRRTKIRIGYYSPDFRIHPVSSLAIRLFEYHDRSKFELIAFFFGSETRDEMTSRIGAAFDQFIDVRTISDMEVAALSRKLGIDIAIDLGGHTKDCRTGIFAYRAAPIQVNYLGYTATMGADYIDYIVADDVVIEEKSRIHYKEKIAYLPDSYLAGDPQREISKRVFTRLELELPESGFIFCCFNAIYKINPEVFDVWAEILRRVSGSVLWLSPASATVIENLRKEAASRGLEPKRLIFSSRIDSPAEHLARVRVADLFLDTWPFNAHSTAVDALWAGVPLITCMGETFASRVAGSVLRAMEVPELIALSTSAYADLAIGLATNPVKLEELKNKLMSKRLTTPFFDPQRFAKNIESAFEKMYERYQDGLEPEHLYIQ